MTPPPSFGITSSLSFLSFFARRPPGSPGRLRLPPASSSRRLSVNSLPSLFCHFTNFHPDCVTLYTKIQNAEKTAAQISPSRHFSNFHLFAYVVYSIFLFTLWPLVSASQLRPAAALPCWRYSAWLPKRTLSLMTAFKGNKRGSGLLCVL